jgi:hypothetical protein
LRVRFPQGTFKFSGNEDVSLPFFILWCLREPEKADVYPE